MSDEIKEILDEMINSKDYQDYKIYGKRLKEIGQNLLNYITNLQQYYNDNVNKYEDLLFRYSELQQENDDLKNRLENAVADCNLRLQENENLKKKLNCKEILKQGMPENTEFVILTKANYDRQQKDIELELIDYKSRIEKAVEYIEEDILNQKIDKVDWDFDECYFSDMAAERIKPLIDILQSAEDSDLQDQ